VSNGKIASIIEGSPAETAGIRAGDLLLSINGRPVRDVIDYLFLSCGETLSLEIKRENVLYQATIDKDEEEILGLRFETEIFDRLKTCHNNCAFCFVMQVPPHMRETLKIRDDDYRLSFLSGNFVTLTNLTEEDWEKIRSYRLSPLYVSVHATNPEVRERIFGTEKARAIIGDLQRLGAWGISVHTQIVLCPGINDGSELERTVHELSALFPTVASIAIVPVGITRYLPRNSPIKGLARHSMALIIEKVRRWQRIFRRMYGTALVYLSDEFYIRTATPLPRASEYEDFPQIENGVGMMRKLITEYNRSRRFLPKRLARPREVSLVTAELASAFIETIAEDFRKIEGLRLRVHRVKNRFWGSHVDVAGLLTGQDILSTVMSDKAYSTIVIPSVCIRDGRQFLDDISISCLETETGREVVAADPTFPSLRRAILGEMAHYASRRRKYG
jgi:putative radical SAM enzyme (TIGR03279 family)